MASTIATDIGPSVTKDPRFLAGRKLIERGKAGEAIEVFGSLLEECRHQWGDSSIETCPAYYEYGNSLLRANGTLSIVDDKDVDVDDNNDKSPGDENQSDDLELSLEMMENAFSILEEYSETDLQSKNNTTNQGTTNASNDINYTEWAASQLPRVLTGIGDVLSTLRRHADAADVYSRALELRRTILQSCCSDNEKKKVEHLKAYRMVCEGNLLIAEALLDCPPEKDVLTTETQSLIVKASERVEYARGYYDQARDALQETIVAMGSIPNNTASTDASDSFQREKQDVCFLATLLMGVGERLAVIDESRNESLQKADSRDSSPNGRPNEPPAKKRPRRSKDS